MNLKHIINLTLLSGIALASATFLAGATFTDEFNSNSLGSYKSNVSGGGAGNWSINGGVLQYVRTGTTTADATLTWEHDSLDFASSVTNTISVTVKYGFDSGFSGLVFNHAGDSQTYYALRLSSNGQLQLVKIINGGGASLVSGVYGSLNKSIAFNQDVTLSVTNDGGRVYNISVVASDSSVLETIRFESSESGASFLTSGYAGIYVNNVGGVESFSVSPVTIPVPELASTSCLLGVLAGLFVCQRLWAQKRACR